MAEKETAPRNPMVKMMIDYFDEWFTSTHGFRFTWSQKEAAQMRNLYNTIAKYLQNQGQPYGQQDVLVLFQKILMLINEVKAAKWYFDNACPSIFVSKYNSILSVISAEAKKMEAKTQAQKPKYNFDE